MSSGGEAGVLGKETVTTRTMQSLRFMLYKPICVGLDFELSD